MRGPGLALATAVLGLAGSAAAQDAAPARPEPLFNHWQEDWSVLADPRVHHEPLDGLKRIPLGADPSDYLSFGARQRLRYEANDAPAFGVGGRKDDYVISRTELHADLRAGGMQAFVQLESTFAPGKSRLSPVDANRADIEQAFVAYVQRSGGGVLKLRLGRQQFAFDLQRFVSVRDGPNVRQSFDGAWADFETGPWRLISYWTQPVVNRDLRALDDRSSDRFTFSGVRVERQVFGGQELSTYWSQYRQEGVVYAGLRGTDRRDVFDVRFAGKAGAVDWDLEAMGQTGDFAGRSVSAWAFGARAGYTLSAPLSPRLGLQVDGASGDRDSKDGVLGTFNPLFPNGYYVTLAGYTGFVNFIHVKPSVTVKPLPKLTATLAAAAQWRETTADAVYTQPISPVPGTAGENGRYTGAYAQLRLDYQISPHLTGALEAVHFAVGSALRRVGARDSDYLGVELKSAW